MSACCQAANVLLLPPKVIAQPARHSKARLRRKKAPAMAEARKPLLSSLRLLLREEKQGDAVHPGPDFIPDLDDRLHAEGRKGLSVGAQSARP